MKKVKIIFAMVLLGIITKETIAQDECPSFKMGRKRVQLKFIPKMKKKGAVIKFTPTFIYGILQPYMREESYTKQNGQVANSSSKSYGNTNTNTYTGYILPVSYETKIGKKSTLQFYGACEMLFRFSYPDTFLYDYPTIDITQYIKPVDTLSSGISGGGGIGEIVHYDEIFSINCRIGVQYRFYPFQKAYKGFYIAPDFAISYGKNEYIDLDTRPENINYAFTQKNLVFNAGLQSGYQFIIKKHFVIDLTSGLTLKQGVNFKKKYVNAEATDEGLKYKYPNTEALHHYYKPGLSFGIGLGYKF